jgi:hypothetical protein
LAALPAPMSRLASAFRFGISPGGSGKVDTLGEAVADEDDLAAAAEVTAVVPAAAGGVHLAVLVTLAVAVSFTDVTDVALDATAICALRFTGLVVVTEATVHEAVLSPLVQPLVNSGFWLDGWEVSVTDTFEAEPFLVETCTV